MIHTGERPNHCSQCDKTFSYSTTHKIFLMIHTQDKPHQCTLCDTTFSRNSHLINHMMIHTGEKPHQRSQCGKIFTENDQFLSHMITHTGERPHQCSQCDKALLKNAILQGIWWVTQEKNHTSAASATRLSYMYYPTPKLYIIQSEEVCLNLFNLNRYLNIHIFQNWILI